jgi:hypothetical protein
MKYKQSDRHMMTTMTNEKVMGIHNMDFGFSKRQK